MYIMRFLPQDSCRVLALKIEIEHLGKTAEIFLFRVLAVLCYIDKREVKRFAILPHDHGRHGTVSVCRPDNRRKRSPEFLPVGFVAESAECARAKGYLPRRYRRKARIGREDKFLAGLFSRGVHARYESVMHLACRHNLVLRRRKFIFHTRNKRTLALGDIARAQKPEYLLFAVDIARIDDIAVFSHYLDYEIPFAGKSEFIIRIERYLHRALKAERIYPRDCSTRNMPAKLLAKGRRRLGIFPCRLRYTHARSPRSGAEEQTARLPAPAAEEYHAIARWLIYFLYFRAAKRRVKLARNKCGCKCIERHFLSFHAKCGQDKGT